MEKQNIDQDTDLMPKAIEVTLMDSPTQSVEKFPSEKGDTVLLEDNLGTYVYNIAFDDSQHRVVQACRAHTPNEHASPAHFEEWVIVSDVRRHPSSLANVTKAYVEATSSSVNFLIVGNERMAKCCK